MADFVYDIGDEIGEFEVVSRSENSLNGELQYTIISKAAAAARREAEAEDARRAAEASPELAETTIEDAASAVALEEEPETLQPKS